MNPFNRFEQFTNYQGDDLDSLKAKAESLKSEMEEEEECPSNYVKVDKCPLDKGLDAGSPTQYMNKKEELIYKIKVEIQKITNSKLEKQLELKRLEDCPKCTPEFNSKKDNIISVILNDNTFIDTYKKILFAVNNNKSLTDANYNSIIRLIDNSSFPGENIENIEDILYNTCTGNAVKKNVSPNNKYMYDCSPCLYNKVANSDNTRCLLSDAYCAEEEEGMELGEEGSCIYPPKPPCADNEERHADGSCHKKCPATFNNPCKDGIEEESPRDSLTNGEENIYQDSLDSLSAKILKLQTEINKLENNRNCGCTKGNLKDYRYQIDEETEEEEAIPTNKLILMNKIKSKKNSLDKLTQLKNLIQDIGTLKYTENIHNKVMLLLNNFTSTLFNQIINLINLQNASSDNNPVIPEIVDQEINILSKKVCISKRDDLKCNHVEPYSPLTLFGTNPVTKLRYTATERENKEKEYKNRCDIKNGEVSECCDPNDASLNSLYSKIPKSLKEKYPYVRLARNTETGEDVFRVCVGNNCVSEGYHKPNAYELCRLNKSTVNYDSTNKIASNLLPNCHNSLCSINDYTPFISDPFDQKNTQYEDYQIYSSFKNDNLERFKEVISQEKNINRKLSYGYPGNTLLHEAIFHKSKECLEELMKNNLDESLKSENKDGNTPLHLAALAGDTNLMYKLIMLGSDISQTNVHGDSALHSAIRSSKFDAVLLMLNNGASKSSKNKLGETPLHTAILTKKKNTKLIKYLIYDGSDILTRNKKNESLLQSLSQQPSTTDNEDIRTKLQKAYRDKYTNNTEGYNKLLNDDPYIRPFEIDGNLNQPVENVDVQYIQNDTPGSYIDKNDLYRDSNVKPYKILPLNARKIMEKYEREEFTNYPDDDNITDNNKGNNMNNYYRIIIVSILLVILLFCVLKYLKL